MNCRNCGAKIEKGSFFCDACGESVGTIAELELMRKREKRKMKKRITMCIAVIMFIVIGAYTSVQLVYNNRENREKIEALDKMKASLESKPVIKNEDEAVEEKSDEAVESAENDAAENVETTQTEAVEPTPSPAVTPAPVPAATPVATPAPVAAVVATDDTYLYPSDTALFTDEFIASLDKQKARLVRNELYARYGLVFKQADIKRYFQSKTWYKPISGITTTQILHKFNSVERSNHSRLVRYEKSKGWIK